MVSTLAACEALRSPAVRAATWTTRAAVSRTHLQQQQRLHCARAPVHRQATAAHADADSYSDDSSISSSCQSSIARRRRQQRTTAATSTAAAAAAAAPKQKDSDYEQSLHAFQQQQQQQQYSAGTVDVSLDAPVMPRPVHPALVTSAALVLALLAVAVAARIPLLLSALGSTLQRGWGACSELASRLNVGGAVEEARYTERSLHIH
jgi:hypothetical protein